MGLTIEPSVIHQLDSAETLRQVKSLPSDQLYTRMGHPTIGTVAAKLAELEQADDALLFASGMGAITTTLLTLLSRGDHLLVQRDAFSVTRKFLNAAGPQFGELGGNFRSCGETPNATV